VASAICVPKASFSSLSMVIWVVTSLSRRPNPDFPDAIDEDEEEEEACLLRIMGRQFSLSSIVLMLLYDTVSQMN
jgi:hypothetical protein